MKNMISCDEKGSPIKFLKPNILLTKVDVLKV